MNEFLKTREQITQSTEWLLANGYVSHPISCKDFELALVVKNLTDGDLLDMGADGSFVLHNAIKKNTIGRKVGIDLIEVTGDNKAEGAEYFKCDIINTPFEDNSFDIISCLSVLEHQVDVVKFVKECSRLLRIEGMIYISFDFWKPRPDTSKMKLYSLDWNILDKQDVINLINCLHLVGLNITSNIDWIVQDAVINDQYCSPAKDVSYTFGILQFIKQ